MKDVIASSCVGIGQLAIGHPFDTAKILIQNKQKWFPHPIKRYYRGWKFPLFYSSIFNITCFTTHERTYQYTNNHFYSGALGGLAISPITYILESFKIQFQVTPPPTNISSPHNTSPSSSKQLKNTPTNKQIIANTIKQLKTTRGLYSTTARETLAMGVYFYTFHTLKQHTDSTLLSGALTGVASWTTTYPIDVIMSRQVAQNITIKQAIQQGNLWKGYRVCIARAMLVNAANFKIYETVIHSTTLDKYLDLNLNLNLK
jgi:solute carrier family 25 carnitine/acylcarnitine transporter 20/29